MTEISSSTTVAGLGELIRNKRQDKQMTLTQVSDLSGVPKGTLSKIENGLLIIRDFHVALSIASVLNIPIEEVIERYIDVERNQDNLLSALTQAISQPSPSFLATKICTKLLETSKEPTEDLIERLYDFTNNVQDESQKLAMYNNISKIADDYSIRPFLAKSMLQVYLIQRNNFSILRHTYKQGKEILNHARFLPLEDQITYYFKLGAHAYLLRKYKDAITYYKVMISLDTTEGELKAYAINSLAFCYYFLNQYDLAEQYLRTSKAFNFPFVKEHSSYLTALLDGKKGNIDLAIIQLESCLETYHIKVSIMYDLLDLYIQQRDIPAAEQLFQYEKDFDDITSISNPALVTEYADYYAKKSEFFKLLNNQEAAYNSLLQSIMLFISVDRYRDVSECVGTLLSDMSITLDNTEILDKIKLVSAYLKKP